MRGSRCARAQAGRQHRQPREQRLRPPGCTRAARALNSLLALYTALPSHPNIANLPVAPPCIWRARSKVCSALALPAQHSPPGPTHPAAQMPLLASRKWRHAAYRQPSACRQMRVEQSASESGAEGRRAIDGRPLALPPQVETCQAGRHTHRLLSQDNQVCSMNIVCRGAAHLLGNQLGKRGRVAQALSARHASLAGGSGKRRVAAT